MKGLRKISNAKTKKAKKKQNRGLCQNVPVEGSLGVDSQLPGPTRGRAHVTSPLSRVKPMPMKKAHLPLVMESE